MQKLISLIVVGLMVLTLNVSATTWNVTVNDPNNGYPCAGTVGSFGWAIAQFNAAGAGNHIINIQTSASILQNPACWTLNNAAANLTISGNGNSIIAPGYGTWSITLNRLVINDFTINTGFGTTATNLAGGGGHQINNSSLVNVSFNFTSSNNIISNSTIAGNVSSVITSFTGSSNNTISGSTFSTGQLRFSGATNNSITANKFITNSYVDLASSSNNNSFYGNWFNLNAAGTGLSTNTNGYSMTIDGSTGNIIGGNAAWKRNVFGLLCTNAIVVQNGSANTRIVSNYFGTDRNGTTRLSGAGTNSTILLKASQNVVIDSNVVSSAQNTTGGAIEFNIGNSNGASIKYNYIGLNANGTGLPSGNAAGFGNNNTGIYAFAGSLDNATITGNVIAAGGSNAYGIQIAVANSGITINQNIIGLDRTGVYNALNDVGNGQSGILFTGAVTNLRILNNTVSRNGILTGGSCSAQQQSCGIIFQAIAVNSATISGNNIGVDNNMNPAGNQFTGLYFFQTGNMGGSNVNNVIVSGNTLGANGNCSALSSHGFASFQGNYFTFSNNNVGVGTGSQNVGNFASGIEINTANNFLILNNNIAYNKGQRISAQAEACAGIALFTASNGTISGNNIYSQANAGGAFISNNGIFVQRGGSIVIGGGAANNIYSNGTHGIVVFDNADFVNMFNNSIYCNGAKGINIACSGFAGKTAGNSSFGCGTLTLNTFTPTVTGVSGGRPTNSVVYVYGTNLCQSTTCGTNPQGQNLFTLSTTSYPTASTWAYNQASPLTGDITALAVGTGANCSGAYCRTSEYTNCVDNIVLPIVLKSFNALANADKSVSLVWITSKEINNDYFIIEKSTNGVDFQYVAKVNGSNNSNRLVTYEFTDETSNSARVYYRLKQFDRNGAYSYSEIISVSFSSAENVGLYPNPNNGNFKVIAVSGVESQVLISDTAGKLVFVSTQMVSEAGELNIETNLANGVYLVKIVSESGTTHHKIIIE